MLAMYRSAADLFLRIAHQLDSLETVVWNGGTMGELSRTDDAVLNSLMDREIDIMLIADDPLIMRTQLPLSSTFFGRFGVQLIGAEVRDPDTGQRVFDGVDNDTITDGMTLVDCQLPRLDHDRGGRYAPNVLFRTNGDEASAILTRTGTGSVGSVRFEEGYRRSVILGINIARFQDGFQLTELLDKSVNWLENAPREVVDDTVTSVEEQRERIGVAMSLNGNPATTSTTVILEGDAGSVDVGLYTVGGQLLGSVYNGPVSGTMEIPVDVSSYARGTIFVIARTARGTIHSTFIKQ